MGRAVNCVALSRFTDAMDKASERGNGYSISSSLNGVDRVCGPTRREPLSNATPALESLGKPAMPACLRLVVTFDSGSEGYTINRTAHQPALFMKDPHFVVW